MNSTGSRDRLFAVAVLVVLCLGHTLSGLAAVVHTDFARDASTALDIARCERFPLHGPLLGNAVHVGPLWFYLLAGPLLLSQSWAAIGLFTGALAAAKFVLAYVIGTRLQDRWLGLLFAGALTLPGWGWMELILPSHTSVMCTAVLLIVLALLEFRDHRSGLRAIFVGLALSVGLHAHPAMAPVVAIGGIAMGYLSWHSARRFRYVALSVGAALLPFAPYFYEQWIAGVPDLSRVANYLHYNRIADPIGNLAQLWYGIAVTGPRYVSTYVFDLPLAGRLALYAALLAVVTIAVIGLYRRSKQRRWATVIAMTLLALVIVSAGIVSLRPSTPFYMVFPLLPPLAFLVALGLRNARPDPLGIRFSRLASLLLVAQFLALGYRTTDTLIEGRWDAQLRNIFEMKNATLEQDRNLLLLPIAAMRQSGRYLCANDHLVMHGSYAFHLKFNYGLERRLRCRTADQVVAGGTDATAHHALGITETLLPEGLKELVVDRVGPVAILTAILPVFPPQGYPMSPSDVYPPFSVPGEGQRTAKTEVELSARDVVAVTNLFPYTMAAPLVEVAIGESRDFAVEVARDDTTVLYACARCQAEAIARWTLTITASDPYRVDVVAIRPASARPGSSDPGSSITRTPIAG